MGLLRLKVNGSYVDVARGPAGPIGPQGPPGPDVNPVTTAQRDALAASEGVIVFNTTVGRLESYINGAWKPVLIGGEPINLENFAEMYVSSSSQNITIDFASKSLVELTFAGINNLTWANIPNGDNRVVSVTLKVNSTVTGITWPAGTKFSGGESPALDGETWITLVALGGVVSAGIAWTGVVAV